MAQKKPSASERVHVVKRDSGWAVKKEGSKKASKIHDTKEEAIKDARKSKKSGSDVVIHKKDGSIQKWEKSNKQ